MIYSLTAKYAVRALIQLAGSGAAEPIRISILAQRAGVPQSYLAKLMGRLVRDGILRSLRGPGGGVSFARPAGRVTLADVVESADGPDALAICLFGSGRCAAEPVCTFHHVWAPARDQLLAFLRNTTIADLARAETGHP